MILSWLRLDRVVFEAMLGVLGAPEQPDTCLLASQPADTVSDQLSVWLLVPLVHRNGCVYLARQRWFAYACELMGQGA